MASEVQDEIGYAALVQEALRGVARAALQHAAREGLPGEHHFYVSFRTAAEGVTLAPRLRAQFPDEMTVVLQHQYWNLEADERSFSVTLRFGGQPERLTVPFAALTAFVDPSVEFGLTFPGPGDRETTTPEHAATPPASVPKLEIVRKEQEKVVELSAFKRPRRRRPASD